MTYKIIKKAFFVGCKLDHYTPAQIDFYNSRESALNEAISITDYYCDGNIERYISEHSNELRESGVDEHDSMFIMRLRLADCGRAYSSDLVLYKGEQVLRWVADEAIKNAKLIRNSIKALKAYKDVEKYPSGIDPVIFELYQPLKALVDENEAEVSIFTDEHGYWWKEGGGYTNEKVNIGVFTIAKALKMVSGSSPEKRLQIHFT